MRYRMTVLLQAVALLALCGATSARALEIYGGVEATATNMSGACDNAASGLGFSGTCDDKDTGGKVFVGLQLLPLTAVELGYIDFGTTKTSGTLSGAPAAPDLKANATYLAFLLRATFFERLTVYGKAGADYWQASGSLGSASLGTSHNADGVSFMYGVGASFKIIGPLGVIAEAERYQNVGDQSKTGQANINAFSLGVVLRF